MRDVRMLQIVPVGHPVDSSLFLTRRFLSREKPCGAIALALTIKCMTVLMATDAVDAPARLAAPAGTVPAVQHAIDIMRFIRGTGNEPVKMMVLSRELGLNPSTCYNILKTLQQAGWLGYNATTKCYELGYELAQLSALVSGIGQLEQFAVEQAAEIASSIGMTCLVAEKRENAGFVVVGKGESTRRVRVTASVGECFPANAPVFAKAYYAWCQEAAFDAMVGRYGLAARPRKVVSIESLKQEIAAVRLRGYATSVGELFPEHNEVASAIIDPSGRVAYLLVVTGFSSQLTARTLAPIGHRLHAIARKIMQSAGGEYPSDWKNLTGWRDL
jgi:IclR family acetate operon transcriptional repressor